MMDKLLVYLGLFFNETIFNFPNYEKRIIFSMIGYFAFLFIFLRISYEVFIIKKINLKGIFLMSFVLFLLRGDLIKVQIAIAFTIYLIISLDENQKKNVYLILYKSLAWICFGGLIVFIVIYFSPNLIKGEALESANPLKTYYGIYYREYFITSLLVKNNNLVYRFQSIFGEPGLLGTIIGTIFLFDYNYSILKKERIVLLISGLLTLSAAFYVFLLLKIIFLIKSKKIKFFLIIFNIVFSIFLFSNNNELFDKTYGRIIHIKNNNREDSESKKILNNFMVTSESITGTGEKFFKRYPYLDNSSWRLIVYEKGYIQLILIILFIFFATDFLSQKNKIKISIIFFLSSLYQRPEIFSVLNLVILICGADYSRITLEYKDVLD